MGITQKMPVEPTFRDMLKDIACARLSTSSNYDDRMLLNIIDDILKRLILLDIEK